MKQKDASGKKERRLKMLIVDDDVIGLQNLSHMLSPYGKTATAVDAESAVQTFQTAIATEDPFDFICLDMTAHNQDREILNQIRSIETNRGIHPLDGVKIIMTAAPSTDNGDSDESAFKSGCAGYLKKPIDESKLIAMLKTLNFDKKLIKSDPIGGTK